VKAVEPPPMHPFFSHDRPRLASSVNITPTAPQFQIVLD
jgi:hypothetical protein